MEVELIMTGLSHQYHRRGDYVIRWSCHWRFIVLRGNHQLLGDVHKEMLDTIIRLGQPEN